MADQEAKMRYLFEQLGVSGNKAVVDSFVTAPSPSFPGPREPARRGRDRVARAIPRLVKTMPPGYRGLGPPSVTAVAPGQRR